LQGWNSTWDRYVTDEFILKDTEENRKLQKELAEEAQLTPLVLPNWSIAPGRTLKSYCSRGGNLYRKERKKRLKPEPKSLIIEPANNSVDVKSMVEDDNVPARSDTILLPKRRLPELDFPDNLKYHIGYNCHLVHEKNTVSSIMYQLYIDIYGFFLLLISQ